MLLCQILNSRRMRGVCLSLLASGLLTAPFLSARADGAIQDGDVKTRTIEIPFTSHDGYPMLGKLTIPESGSPHPVLIYVQTAEGMTVDMKRSLGGGKTFNYFDLYARKLPAMNVAFFSYEGRGISMGDQPTRFEKIDWAIYNTSTLENKVRDLMSAVRVVEKQPGIKTSRIFLMGASEGTLLAAEAASRMPGEIAGLVLYGVMSDNMKEIFRFINTGGGFMVYRSFFDTDNDGKISKAEFEADPKKYRQIVFKNAGFENFDRNEDGYFTVDEMQALAKANLDAIVNNDFVHLNKWAKGGGAGVSTPQDWFKDHFAHAPIWTFLSRLDIPIGFFHGDRDNNAPIEGVRKLEELAKKAGKTKMEFHYFEGLDHSLGITIYFVNGTIPAGHKAIFEFINLQANKK